MRVFERGWVSSNNVLLFDDEHNATLVDTGYVAHGAQTLQLVRHALAGRTLARIINTHLHSDHCGGNAMLKRELGAIIMVPAGQAQAVERWDEAALSYAACGQQCERFTADALIHPGQSVQMGGQAWEIFASPGHDAHSVVLWNARERMLISADALWERGFGAIFPEAAGESGFAEQRAILHLIDDLDPVLVVPGHGAPFADVRQSLAVAFQRLDALEASPERNARSVAKTLIKFHLLIVRQTRLTDLIHHFSETGYMEQINRRYFRLTSDQFIRRTVDELVSGGTAELRDGTVYDREL